MTDFKAPQPIHDGGNAFPLPLGTMNCSEPEQSGGMSLRDYFAAKALIGVMQMVSDGKHEPDIKDLPLEQVDFIAKSAYELADAMLKARTA